MLRGFCSSAWSDRTEPPVGLEGAWTDDTRRLRPGGLLIARQPLDGDPFLEDRIDAMSAPDTMRGTVAETSTRAGAIVA